MDLGNKTVIIDIKVKDLIRAVNFYKDVLKLKLLIKEKTWASFKAENIELHLNLYWGATSGVEFKVEDIGKWVKELKGNGINFTSKIETYSWGKITYFIDSEGNELSLIEESLK